VSTILLVEDDQRLRSSLVATLGGEGYEVQAVGSVTEARDALGGQDVALLLVDVRLGSGPTGVDLVRELSAAGSLPPTIVISGAATIAETVEALRLGVFDFLEKPVSRERLLQSAANALEQHRLRAMVADLASRLDSEQRLLGESAAMLKLREEIGRVAATSARVLIRGESGTGKELVAELIHEGSERAGRPFIRLNMAALPATLVEDELFGHARGAFTDAREARAGLFEEASGGTLFLDEIGDMEAALQARLLRVLEDGVVRRIGESREREVDVRIVAATHRHLEADVEAGRFREDLFYRLFHVPLHVPPLREREHDAALLFRHFMDHWARRHRLRPRVVDELVYPALDAYPWPGNVRELRNLCERLVVLGRDPISAEQLLLDAPVDRGGLDGAWLREQRLGAVGRVAPFRQFKQETEREYLEAVLLATGWNVSEAARLLGLQRSYLHEKLVALDLVRPS